MAKRNGKVKHLGKVSNKPTRLLDALEWKGGPQVITLDCSEFSSHCPVTGQPDFGRLVIVYVPDKHIVETKSLKLFIWSYRDRKQFNESIVDEIAGIFFHQIKPVTVRVEGYFNPRGGISVNPVSERTKQL